MSALQHPTLYGFLNQIKPGERAASAAHRTKMALNRRSRQQRLLTVAAAGALAALPAPTVAAAATSFTAPAAAYTRPLGGPIPDVTSSPEHGPKAQAGRGISLGGIGAGAFMINQAGTFGPWTFGDDAMPEERILPQAAFHIRVQSGHNAASVTTLAVNSQYGSIPPAWRGLQPGQGSYGALYPFGWITYRGLPSRVAMRFFSPIVPRNDYWSSMPAAFFDLRVANPTRRVQKVSLMFTFPNATEHAGASYQGPATVRAGLGSRSAADRRSSVRGVVLSSSSAENTPDARDSEWVIAARPSRGQRFSYTTSWNAAQDGSDVYRTFSRTGVLPDRPLDSSHSAGAVAVSFQLRPHQASTVRFNLSWDFPQVSYGPTSNTVWMRRYTDFFGARGTQHNDYLAGSYRFHQGFRIADTMLTRHDQALQAVSRWWIPVAADPAYPVWLRTAALNEVGDLAFNESFWEGGLVSTTDSPTAGGPRIGSQVPGTHLFSNTEGGGFADANCWDCYLYGYRMVQQLFPELQRDVLRGWTSMILQDPNGLAPHDAGSTDPWIKWTASSGPASAPPPVGSQPINEPASYIFQAYNYYHSTADASFLRFAYPAMLATLKYMQQHVAAGDHLPLDGPVFNNTYDLWPMTGHGIYNSELFLLSEDVMIAATRQALALGIPAATSAELDGLTAEFPQAQAEFESDFWDSGTPPLSPHYKIDSGSPEYGDGIMADALFAQHLAEAAGLPDLVNPAQIPTHITTAYPLLTQFKDSEGHGLGAANGVNALGQEIRTSPGEANEVWTGTSWMLAATLYHEGARFNNAAFKTDSLTLGQALYHQIYEQQSNGFAFDIPEAWGVTGTSVYRDTTYLRPRSVWELLSTIKAPRIPSP